MHAVSSIVCSCQSTQPPQTEAKRVQHFSGLSAREMSPGSQRTRRSPARSMSPRTVDAIPTHLNLHARASHQVIDRTHLQFSSQAKQQTGLRLTGQRLGARRARG